MPLPVVFIKVHPLLDPFQLCYNYMEQVERTGEARSRIISRLSPVAGFCSAHSHELQALAGRVLPRFFLKEETGTVSRAWYHLKQIYEADSPFSLL